MGNEVRLSEVRPGESWQLAMTLIARLTRNGTPLYLGDLLISREGKTSERVDIPTVANINAKLPPDITRSVVGMSQKLNLISDRLLVAWAGNMLQARLLTREIAEKVADGIATKWQDIGAIIDRIPEGDRNDVSLIGTILNPGIDIQHFHLCAQKKLVNGIEIVTAGSGADDLIALASQTGVIQTGTTDNFLWAVKQGLSLAAALVGYELSTGDNILNWWGGAIEIAGIANGRFRKASNILHSIWQATMTDKDRYEIRLIPKFIKYDYFEDVLLVQTLDVSDPLGVGTGEVNEHALWCYTPLLKNRNQYDFSKLVIPDFSHHTLCCFISMPSGAKFLRIYHSNTGDTPLRVNPSAQDSSGRPIAFISFQGRLIIELMNGIASASPEVTSQN